MGLTFHETVRGRNFFEGQLPQLIKSLTRIADNLEKPSQGINASTTVYVCYHENSPEISIENSVVDRMCVAHSLEEVKKIVIGWLEEGKKSEYVPLDEYEQTGFFKDIMLGKNTALTLYHKKDEKSRLYYSLTVKVFSREEV